MFRFQEKVIAFKARRTSKIQFNLKVNTEKSTLRDDPSSRKKISNNLMSLYRKERTIIRV